MKIHIIYLQASLILGKRTKWAFFLCGEDNMSLFISRKTLKAFIAIFPVLQNIQGLEKSQSFSSFKVMHVPCTTIAFMYVVAWWRVDCLIKIIFHSHVHKLERNAMQWISHQKAMWKRLDTGKYMWSAFETRRMQTGKYQYWQGANKGFMLLCQNLISWHLQVFIAFSAKLTFLSWPVGRKSFEGTITGTSQALFCSYNKIIFLTSLNESSSNICSVRKHGKLRYLYVF